MCRFNAHRWNEPMLLKHVLAVPLLFSREHYQYIGRLPLKSNTQGQPAETRLDSISSLSAPSFLIVLHYTIPPVILEVNTRPQIKYPRSWALIHDIINQLPIICCYHEVRHFLSYNTLRECKIDIITSIR